MNSLKIDLSKQKKGIYFVKHENDEQKTYFKIIKN
ncbi:MAG: T9SS type A sorting domain-containing protein [Chlorobi bacterium]|nr:T9SS type A sorting domain-containing protein [Chlorobiota bacterium]